MSFQPSKYITFTFHRIRKPKTKGRVSKSSKVCDLSKNALNEKFGGMKVEEAEKLEFTNQKGARICYALNEINSLNGINMARKGININKIKQVVNKRKEDEIMQKTNIFQEEDGFETSLECSEKFFTDDSVNEETQNLMIDKENYSSRENFSKIQTIKNLEISLNNKKYSNEKKKFKPCLSINIDEIRQKEILYAFDSDYIEKNYESNEFNWLMRAILVDWMMEVCHDFSMKRDTLYEAVQLLDRFLEKKPECVFKDNLQLIGLVSIHIIAKKEEIYPPKLQSLIRLNPVNFTKEKIDEIELIILRMSNWLINPLTHNFWLNTILYQWDRYLLINKDKFYTHDYETAFFLEESVDSFINYRLASNILDCSLLDSKIFEISSKGLICGLIYITAGLAIRKFNIETIKNFNKNNMEEWAFKNDNFNIFFNGFLKENFDSQIEEILESIIFVSSFTQVNLNFGFPKGFKDLSQSQYSNLISTQVHNINALQYVREKRENEFFN